MPTVSILSILFLFLGALISAWSYLSFAPVIVAGIFYTAIYALLTVTPLGGAAERQAEKLVVALAAAGCRVTILTPRLDVRSSDVEEVAGVRIERFALTDLAQR